MNKVYHLHSQISKKHVLGREYVACSIDNAVVSTYYKCGSLNEFKQIFDSFEIQDVVTWNTLISEYMQRKCFNEIWVLFQCMQLRGILPNDATFTYALKSCGKIGLTRMGTQLHAMIAAKKDPLKSNPFVRSALVDMYVKCNTLQDAREILDSLLIRDVVTWNTLITGYVQHGYGKEALHCFDRMRREGVYPNVVTFACILKACSITGDIAKGNEMYIEAAKTGHLDTNLFIASGLIDMYVRCGSLAKAQAVFHTISNRNIVVWNSLIAGYAQQEYGEEALHYFERLHQEGLCPNAITFSCSLKACGSASTTAAKKGRAIHADIARNGLLGKNIFIGSALVDMYAKCGELAKAQEVFDMLPERNVVTWGALITAYSQLGRAENTLSIFDEMIKQGNKPDRVVFLSILNACSHAGMIDKGQTYFEAMSVQYGIPSTMEHHTTIIDLLGRAGQLEWALEMMMKTPFHPTNVMWLALLGACRKWHNVEVGRYAFDQAVRSNEKEDAAYVCMYNIYSDVGMVEDARKVEGMLMKQWSNS